MNRIFQFFSRSKKVKENPEHFTIAHIIEPVIADSTSDLVIAQPITFETMHKAKEFARGTVNVELLATQFHDETQIPLPASFTRTHDLMRSIIDIHSFRKSKKLALIKDILDTLYEATSADYMIYTNVDIALMPSFYCAVARIIRMGYDAFVINRRTITDSYSSIEQIPLMYTEIGQSHKGYDCFVFKRELYPRFKLGNICIGTAWIGRALLANMVAYSKRFKEFRDLHLTFHIGDPCTWRNEEFSDYFQANLDEYQRLFQQIEKEQGKFKSKLRSYLLDTGEKRIIPKFK